MRAPLAEEPSLRDAGLHHTVLAAVAADATFGGPPAEVLSGIVPDKSAKTGHEVDVAVFADGRRLLSIGEVKWSDVMGMAHLARLEKIAGLLTDHDSPPVGVALYSGAGFMPELRRAAERSGGSIQLVGLDRLYTGE